jgi:hypothetical protein
MESGAGGTPGLCAEWPVASTGREGLLRPGCPGADPSRQGRELLMLGIAAAVVFAVAFVIAAAGTATNALFAPTTLLLAGLACLALRLSGFGTSWSAPRRSARR